MRKAILIPSDFGQSSKPVDETLGNLDSEMIKIIQNYEVPMDVKIKNYNQVLQRYMSLQTQRNKPYELEIKESLPPIDFTTIIKGLPESKIPSAKLLMDFISRQGNISIEDNGEISINGTRIQNSNIIDMIHDLVRDRKTHPPAVGIDRLIKALKIANLPTEYIGNKNRLGLFQIPQTPVVRRRPFETVADRLERSPPQWIE